MEPFSLRVSNNAVITGLRTPPASKPPPKDTPLIVALHGGSFSADYYNATPTNSASPYSAFLGVPFVAITRPGYKDSTALPDALPEGKTFLQAEGYYLHYEILPAVWSAYAADYGVTSIVILAHSLSVPMTVVAAALNATETSSSSNELSQKQQQQGDGKAPHDQAPEPEQEQSTLEAEKKSNKKQQDTALQKPATSYPLAGIILSGFGTTPNTPSLARVHPIIDPTASHIKFPPSLKDELMLYPASSGFTSPFIYKRTESLNTRASMAEFIDGIYTWPTYWRSKYAHRVTCPVMYALAEHDCFWLSTKEAIEDFAAAFVGSERVDGGVVVGGVHCLELCRAGRGWYARVFGWAVECGVAFGLRERV
ncbi:MAG: hypothetical protein Q9221_006502 [Calogaya cf. arnoldii]